MNTVELFAGIGGFRLAADRCGWTTIWANDLCPKACAVYRDRFGISEGVEGDIRRLVNDMPPHDVLTAGFPCQPFSSAGKKHGVRDTRGTLFESIIAVLRLRRPRFFVLENVKRLLTMEQGFHFATILQALAELDYRIEWRLLNAMHFGLPQNRQRIFVIGVQAAERNDPSVVQLANFVDLEDLNGGEREALGDSSRWRLIERHGQRFPTWGVAERGRFFAADLETFSTASALVPVRKVLQPDAGPEFDFTIPTLRWLSSNSPVNRFVQGVEILSNQAGGARMGYTIFGVNGLAPTLTSTTSRHYERYKVGDTYRRLTNVEYARIQGFADDHCRAVSVYDQYALFGNAVPPPVARWVLEHLTGTGIRPDSLPQRVRQPGLFDDAYQR